MKFFIKMSYHFASKKVVVMPALIKKIKNGKAYYYIVQSARVNGKPRIVWQKYLGSVATILERYEKTSREKPCEPFPRQWE
jgi:hypothetical protein